MRNWYVFLFIIFFYISSCSNDLGINGISRKKNSSQQDKNSTSDDSKDSEETATRRKLENNGARLLLKSADQLKSSIAICVGANKTTVAEKLLTNTTDEDDEGLAFLSPTQFKPGENIIDSSRILFDSVESTERSGTRNGTISLAYLTALSNTANVVGYNCSVAHLDQGASAELCECETEESAANMLNRCLSLFEPSVLEEKIEVFRQACADDKKGAIASLISSFAFVETP